MLRSLFVLTSVCFAIASGEIYNIKIDDDFPTWIRSNETETLFPESPSGIDVEDPGATTPVSTYDSLEDISHVDVRQDLNNEDLSTSYTPGYCRCINKFYCMGSAVRRGKRAINTPPCRNREDVMCCLTTGPGCGVPANFPYFNPYPLYGEANFGDHPWTALVMDTNNQVIYGLGIVVSWRLVLTTARNVQHLQQRSHRLKVRVGEWDLSTNDEPFKPQEFAVADVIVHPNFNPRTYQNDVAILRLQNYVDLSSYPSIRSGCVAKPEDADRFRGAKCLVAGWGIQPSLRQRITNGNRPNGGINNPSQQQQQPLERNILKEVDVGVVDSRVCQEALRKNVGDPQFLLDTRSFLCAGGEAGKGLCKGDEGAALVCKDRRSERYTVVGMASWGTTCGQSGFPVVFTNIANYYEWIKSVDPQIGQ